MKNPAQRKIRGFWPPLLLETQPDGRIDLEAVTAGTNYFAEVGVSGVYTADTASEFYTMEYEEWNELVTHFRGITDSCKLPAGVGCTWTNQAGVLRRIARARELGFDNIHLSEPYWIKLNEPAQQSFWRAVGEVAGELPIVVYTGSRGQLSLDGMLLRKLCDYCPAIAGTKSTGFDTVVTNSMLLLCSDLAHMVHETVLCAWVAQGAAGCFSSLVALCPPLALHWHQLMDELRWTEAFAIQRRVNLFYEEGVIPIRRAGYVADKTVFELGRVPGATRRQRPPTAAVPDALFVGLEAAAHRHLPEFAEHLRKRGL